MKGQYGERILLLILMTVLFTCFAPGVKAQVKVVEGTIEDRHSGEPVPFASVRFQSTGIGAQADSSGRFHFRFNAWPTDTLLVTSVGFQDYAVAISPPPGDTL